MVYPKIEYEVIGSGVVLWRLVIKQIKSMAIGGRFLHKLGGRSKGMGQPNLWGNKSSNKKLQRFEGIPTRRIKDICLACGSDVLFTLTPMAFLSEQSPPQLIRPGFSPPLTTIYRIHPFSRK